MEGRERGRKTMVEGRGVGETKKTVLSITQEIIEICNSRQNVLFHWSWEKKTQSKGEGERGWRDRKEGWGESREGARGKSRGR